MYVLETSDFVRVYPNDTLIKYSLGEVLDSNPSTLASRLSHAADFIFEKSSDGSDQFYLIKKDRTFMLRDKMLTSTEYGIMMKMISSFYDTETK